VQIRERRYVVDEDLVTGAFAVVRMFAENADADVDDRPEPWPVSAWREREGSDVNFFPATVLLMDHGDPHGSS
jgi:hypothetical protein